MRFYAGRPLNSLFFIIFFNAGFLERRRRTEREGTLYCPFSAAAIAAPGEKANYLRDGHEVREAVSRNWRWRNFKLRLRKLH